MARRGVGPTWPSMELKNGLPRPLWGLAMTKIEKPLKYNASISMSLLGALSFRLKFYFNFVRCLLFRYNLHKDVLKYIL